MPINPDAIDRFLSKPVPFTPACKGAPRDALDNIMSSCTGITYRPLHPSRVSQVEATAFALYCQRSMLIFEPRVGKTKPALDWCEHLKRAGLWKGKGLVIAHAPIGVDVWEREAAKWSTLKLACVLSGQNPKQVFVKAIMDNSDLIVISWGMLQSLFTTKRLNRKDEMTLYADRDTLRMVSEQLSLVIIDEIHYCQDKYSLRFDIASELVQHCQWRLGLTGTPVGRHPLPLWSQCYLIDGGATFGYNYQFFEAAFCIKRKSEHHPSGFVHVFDWDKLPILLDKLASIAMTYELREIHDVNILPGVVELRMRGDQRQEYNAIVERFSNPEEHEDEDIRNTFVRMRQIASGFMPYNDEHGKERMVQFESNPKLEWLSELFDSLPDGLPVVIFHEYIKSGEMISNLLTAKKREHVCFNGRQNDPTLIEQFRAGHVNTLVANTRSGGLSIDLRRAEYLCYFESPCSPTVRKQSESRPLARGDRPLIIDDLICSPVEHRILDMLQEGRDLHKAVTSIRHVMKDKAR